MTSLQSISCGHWNNGIWFILVISQRTTRKTCIQKYNLIFLILWCRHLCGAEVRSGRVHTYGGAIGSLNSSGNFSSPKFWNLYCLQAPTWPIHSTSFHWVWLRLRLTSFSSIGLSSRPCIVHLSVVIVLRLITACFPITYLLSFSTVECIYQIIHRVQPHTRVKVIFRYFIDFINSQMYLSQNPSAHNTCRSRWYSGTHFVDFINARYICQ